MDNYLKGTSKPHNPQHNRAAANNWRDRRQGKRPRFEEKSNSIHSSERNRQNTFSQRTRHLGFRFIEELLENDDLEDIIVKLSNDKGGFKELLENTEISGDMTVLVVRLLAKICTSNFAESKLHLLQLTLKSSFVANLIKLISTLPIQSEKDKERNTFFWNQPDELFNNILYISRSLNDLIPATSCECVVKILTAMKLYAPLIETQHLISFSSTVKDDINNLHAIIEKTFADIKNKNTKDPIDKPCVIEPPDDFRQISVYPSIVEVATTNVPFLRPNVVKGPYQNVNHYLDIQFRLLREDFVAPLRTGICKYIANPKEKLDNIRVYKNIRFLNAEIINEQNCYRIQYDSSNKTKTFQYENSRRFMFGSLLCFTNDNFLSIIFGKIVQRDVKDLEKGHLIVGFDENISLPENIYGQNYLMIESSIYFEPYFHVLNVLKTMQEDNFPMERYIIRVRTDVRPPQYLLKIDPVFYTIEEHSFWPLNWDDRTFYSLNEAQHEAFKAALTQEFSIIQGPPGTGKTFLGLKIAQTLLENTSWYNKTPMLVICYTNHALDQFLEGLLPVTDNILRIGGRSKNEKLSRYNIREKLRGAHNSTVMQVKHEVRESLQKISNINETLKQIEQNESVADFSAFYGVVPQYELSWFSRAKSGDILKWLLGGKENRQFQFHRNQQRVTNDIQTQNLPQTQNNAMDIPEEEQLDQIREQIFDEFDDIHVSSNLKTLISLNSINDTIKMLNGELNWLENKEEWFPQDMFRHEEILIELNDVWMNLQYLKRRFRERSQRQFQEAPQFVNLNNPNQMPPLARWQLYWSWLDQYKLKLLEHRERITLEFRGVYKRYDELMNIENTQIMKESLVVGMTTTGAARLRTSLQTLKSPIVIVEEAAEVLEAHIVSSLTKHCQHLILIGDHQQLKPSTSNFKIETKYHLGISLFERMVINRIHCHKLDIQHRMRPEVSCLIHPTIYSALVDHESVLNRPPILGVENSVFFLDHQEPEQICKDESKKNVHEAKIIINLAKYLVLNGYEPGNITILAAYLGQMFEIQRERRNNILLQDVKIAVLDNYQGEENDIILLSLVRSNAVNNIGFLKKENRVCVALSRARNGLYMIGNMTHLCNNSNIWPKVRESLETQNAIGTYLTLRCQIHKHNTTRIKEVDDFMNVAEGGCTLLCQSPLGCGHICSKLCHINDRNHTEYKCREKCTRTLCNNNEHVCKKLCHEKCGACTYEVVQDLNCGHTVTIECYINPLTYNCPVLIKTTLPCGHDADKPCYVDPEKFTCPHPCDVQVQPCGHACEKLCHIMSDPDHLKYRCLKPCAKTRLGCSLQGDEHPCTKLCSQPCEECIVGVSKERFCSHVYTVPCKEDVNEVECEKPCLKTLPCGHKCKNKCNAPCGNCVVPVTKVVPDCNHEIKIRCYQESDRKFCKQWCPRLLSCGHKCLKKCCEPCTAICKVLVQCSLSSPCGHTIKSVHCHKLGEPDNSTGLLNYCKEKCNTTLKCGHVCRGTCGECFQGRLHRRCQEKCGVPLICNHECDIPCRQACKPCNKPCQYRCEHSKCPKKCGDICTKCPEMCRRVCKHQQCRKKCGDICDIKPCYEPCTNLLKCGHPCVGFCGDPCPILCRVCNREELTHIFLGNEDEEDAIYVMLTDCKHVFESSDLEAWLNLDGNEIKAKECPRCKTLITTTVRYSEFIKRSIRDIMNVKRISIGTFDENNKKRVNLLSEIDELQTKASNLYKDSREFREAINMLKERLQLIKKKNVQVRRQAINKMDLNVVKSKTQMIEYLIEVYGGEQEYKIEPTDKSMLQIAFILNAIIRDEDHISDQKIDDTNLEIQRLSRIVQLEQIQKSPSFAGVSIKEEISTKVKHILEIINSPKRYCGETDTVLQTELEILNKTVASSVKIAEIEKKEVVRALGMGRGHWFKCPNGHYYVIGDCGGANQISKCNECGSLIGGQGHRLLPNQTHAPEMDGSRYPAWSEAANLANYRL